jgi:hypothetical protein
LAFTLPVSKTFVEARTVAVVVYAGFEHPSEVQHEIVQSKTLGGEILSAGGRNGNGRDGMPALHVVESAGGGSCGWC